MANVEIYKTQGGDELVVGANGTLTVEGTLDATGATFNLGNDSITTAMLQDDCVTNDKIADDAVDTAQIVDDAVATAKIDDLAVTTGKIAAGAVTKAKTAMFISDNIIGDGNPQATAHGLGVNPTSANVFVTVVDTAAAGNFAIAIDGTDATNVTITATNTVVYRIMAWAP